MFAPAGIGVREAQAFLAEHLGHPVDHVELVGEGAWSRCFGFTDGARNLVIRFGRYVDDFEKDARAASFSTPALPVPHVSEVGAAFDGFFAISTRAYGRPLESLDADEWEVLVAEARPRPAAVHEGHDITVHDAVLRARRRG